MFGRTRARDRSRKPHAVNGTGSLLAVFEFTTLTAGALTSVPGLVFARASVATVQTGTSTLVTSGISADVARAGKRLDADKVGLVIEEARTNSLHHSRTFTTGSGWNAGSGTFTGGVAVTAPDGAGTASRQQTSVGQFGRVWTGTMPSGARVQSIWVRRHTGASGQHQWYAYDGTTVTSQLASIPAGWSRLSIAITAAGTGGQVEVQSSQDLTASGGGNPGALDNDLDLVQCEAGAFPTEAIVTSGAATATRAGERLYHPAGTHLIDEGRVTFTVRLRPKGSSAQYSADMYLWKIDASNHARVDAATGAIIVTVGGVAYTTAAAMTWAANDTVDIFLAAGGGTDATAAKYRVNNGSATTLSTGSPDTQAALVASSTLDLLCNGTSNQFTAWVESIAFYKYGETPTWAQ